MGPYIIIAILDEYLFLNESYYKVKDNIKILKSGMPETNVVREGLFGQPSHGAKLPIQEIFSRTNSRYLCQLLVARGSLYFVRRAMCGSLNIRRKL